MTTKIEFDKMSEKQKFNKIITLEATIVRQKTTTAEKISVIRSMGLRLKNLARQLNYLADHPYSTGDNYRKRKK